MKYATPLTVALFCAAFGSCDKEPEHHIPVACNVKDTGKEKVVETTGILIEFRIRAGDQPENIPGTGNELLGLIRKRATIQMAPEK